MTPAGVIFFCFPAASRLRHAPAAEQEHEVVHREPVGQVQLVLLHPVAHLPDGGADAEGCVGIYTGGVPVDDHQLAAPIIPHQPRGGVHHQRGAADDEHVGVCDVLQGFFHDGLVEALLIQHHVGLYNAAAGAAGDARRRGHGLHAVELAASAAVVAQDAPVQLQHLAAAGFLVQPVDVLGDDGFQLALPLPLRQLPVGGVGLGVQCQHFAAVKVVKLLRVGLKKRVAEHGFRRILEFLAVQPVHAAEVLDAGLRADACAAEKDDVVAPVHQFFQLHDGFVHRGFPPFLSSKGVLTVNIQIFGSKKSNDSKKAERWFKERRIKYQYIDLYAKGLSLGEYRSVKAAVGFEALVDTRCDAYEDLGLQYVPPQAVDQRIADCPAVFNAPIVRNGRQATVGYCPDVWKTWE